MKSIFSKLTKPGVVIVAELINSFRAKRNPNATGPSNVLPSGLSGYVPGSISGPTVNLNASGFYHTKQINVGIMDTDTMTNLIRNSASDSTFNSYQNISVASLDSIFAPYSVDTTHNFLPHFESPISISSGVPSSRTLNPFDPFYSLSSGSLPTGMPSGIEGRWLKYGHNIGMAASSTASDTGVTDLSFEKDYWNTGDVEKDTIRAVAFRSPMVLSGIGYSVTGVPVPSSGSTFDPRCPYDPSVWKTGPLDARWDEYSKTWGAPIIMMGIARTNFSAASGIFSPASGEVCRVVTNPIARTGQIIGKCTAYVHDPTMGAINSGTIIYFNNIDGHNKIFYAGCSADSGALSLVASWSG